MKLEDQEKLLSLFNEGFSIHIQQVYVTGMVTDIFKNEEGKLCYADDAFDDFPLEEVSSSEVTVYKEIDDWKWF
jgi:hypothetical protein